MVNHDYLISLGNRIRECREKLGLTQQDVADALGYRSKSTIYKIENGMSDISQSRLPDFAKVLHTTPEWIIGAVVEEVKEKEELTLSPKEQVLLKLVRKMSDSQLDNLISFLETK